MIFKAKPIRLYVLFILAAVAVLMLKPHYHGPLGGIIHDYGGNFSASFAAYFIVAIALIGRSSRSLVAALCALLVVEAFEITDGFGIMSNVVDSLDLLANAAGIGLALAVDLLTKQRE